MAGMGLERCAVNLRASVERGRVHGCNDEIWVGDKFCHRMTVNSPELLAAT